MKIMKYRSIYLLLLGLLPLCAKAQNDEETARPQKNVPENIVLMSGNDASNYVGAGEDIISRSPEYDIVKALYGTVSGLTAEQSNGTVGKGVSSILLHGRTPLILIDGFMREISEVTPSEIASIKVLQDAVATAIYGAKGANGALLITTKHGSEGRLNVTAKYQYGVGTAIRKPEFADSYTYATSLNHALANDGLSPRYNAQELEAFRTGSSPYFYPNVNWYDEVLDDVETNHRLDLTFDGGSKRFRYYSNINYIYNNSFLRDQGQDSRFDSNDFNTTLGLRANIDVDLTRSTLMNVGVMGRLSEQNRSTKTGVEDFIYNLPSAAFPVRNEDGTYGGSPIWGSNNPVADLNDRGMHNIYDKMVLANIVLKQDFGDWVKGLTADASASVDYLGTTFDEAYKTYSYVDMNPHMLPDGTVVTTPTKYDKDSPVLDHSSWLRNFALRSEFQGKINYERDFDRHHFDTHAIYRQRSYSDDRRNKSYKNQEVMLTANYNFGDKYFVNAVVNYSGSSYLKDGERFNCYPAVNLGWVASNEKFLKDSKVLSYLKLSASVGKSGYDRNMEHELYIHSFGSDNAGEYYFGVNGEPYWGQAEGNLPTENLTPEESFRYNFSIDTRLFDNRLSIYAQYFKENRSAILVNVNNVSSIIGIPMNRQCLGEQEFQGVDLGLAWNQTSGKFNYGAYVNGSFLTSKIIENGEAFQKYDYLYQRGNKVGQRYGLEAIGFFKDEQQIADSPKQMFGTDVRPGDLMYKDQNGDNVINDEDVVKIGHSGIPSFTYGFGLHFGYSNFELSADFQGCAGVTVNLLNSPLYMPLVDNGNISKTFLDREVVWTPETADIATMPRLTTQTNKNNYRNSSHWYRNGSFLKLRNLTVGYTFPKSMLKFADMKIYVSGTNLFSIDNIDFADPERLGGGYPSARTFWAGVKFNF